MKFMKIGEFIKRRRKELNLSQSDIADALFVTIPTVSKWENKESAPNIYLMIKCAEIFNVSLAELYYGKNFVKVTDNKKVTKNKNVLFGITGIVAFVSIALCICVPLLINNNSMSSPIQIGEDGENEMFSFTVQSNNSVILNEYLGNETEVIIPS